MRLIFAGTPAFAATALTALHQAGHTIPLVLTQPDRPAGRGMKLTASAVKQSALDLGLPLAQPDSLKSETGRRGLWFDFAASGVDDSDTRLPQHPRIAVATLARCCADTTRDTG